MAPELLRHQAFVMPEDPVPDRIVSNMAPWPGDTNAACRHRIALLAAGGLSLDGLRAEQRLRAALTPAG